MLLTIKFAELNLQITGDRLRQHQPFFPFCGVEIIVQAVARVTAEWGRLTAFEFALCFLVGGASLGTVDSAKMPTGWCPDISRN